MPLTPDDDKSTCRWCEVPIVAAEVLTGPPPGVRTRLWIGTEQDPDGQVIRRGDGELRTLAPTRRGARTGWRKPKSPTWRIHNAHSCDPNHQPTPEREAVTQR